MSRAADEQARDVDLGPDARVRPVRQIDAIGVVADRPVLRCRRRRWTIDPLVVRRVERVADDLHVAPPAVGIVGDGVDAVDGRVGVREVDDEERAVRVDVVAAVPVVDRLPAAERERVVADLHDLGRRRTSPTTRSRPSPTRTSPTDRPGGAPCRAARAAATDRRPGPARRAPCTAGGPGVRLRRLQRPAVAVAGRRDCTLVTTYARSPFVKTRALTPSTRTVGTSPRVGGLLGVGDRQHAHLGRRHVVAPPVARDLGDVAPPAAAR